MKAEIVYICSPYKADNEKTLQRNIEYARKLTRKALEHGLTPITPHLYITQCLDENKQQERETGLEAGLKLLEKCDIMIIGSSYGISEGMSREIMKAEQLDIPRIFDTDAWQERSEKK